MDDDGALSLGELRQSMGALSAEGQVATAQELAGGEDARVDYKALVADVIRVEEAGARTGRQTGMGQAMGLQARGIISPLLNQSMYLLQLARGHL